VKIQPPSPREPRVSCGTSQRDRADTLPPGGRVVRQLRGSAVIDDIVLRRLQRRLDDEGIRLTRREPQE
jgi:hypothetical protein